MIGAQADLFGGPDLSLLKGSMRMNIDTIAAGDRKMTSVFERY